MTVAWALLHCTLGDVAIALTMFALAGVVLWRADWPMSRPWAGTAIVVIATMVFTAWSEWFNVYRAGSWAYTVSMPTIFGIGLSLAQAQSPAGQDVDRAHFLRNQSLMHQDPYSEENGVDGGLAAASPNDPDLGVQEILKHVQHYQPFTFSFAAPFYYTSNVALVRRGEHGDVLTVPEASINLYFQLTDHLKVFAGYTFLYWSHIARPGDQVDINVNPNLVPTSMTFGAAGGPARPAFTFHSTDFFAHGVNFGLELRY